MHPLDTDGLSRVPNGPFPIDDFEHHQDKPAIQRHAARGNGTTSSANMVGRVVQSKSSISTQSSMAPNRTSRGSLSSSNVPDLVAPSRVSRKDSGSSLESCEDIQQTPQPHYLLKVQNDGNVVIPETKRECPIHGICEEKFFCAEWMSTSTKHFGRYPPPSDAICPFCDTQFHDSDGYACWRDRMHHVGEHYRDHPGITLEHSMPDYNLYRYFRDLKLIREDDFDEYMSKNTVEPVPGEHVWAIVDPGLLGRSVHTEAPAAHIPTSERRQNYRRPSRR